MYASQYMVIPLLEILTYTKCMLVNTAYHINISYVSDNFIAW